MPCYYPLQALSRQDRDGKREIKIVGSYHQDLKPLEPTCAYDVTKWTSSLLLPCGSCLGCRLERSRQWAVRCLHEASLHDQNCYITLTYSPENMPRDHSLHKDHFQLFMKRLRKRYGSGIRFFHCGEYGEQKARPHYHSCIFGFDFPDKVFHSSRGSYNMYVSQSLIDLWGKGFCTLSDMCFNSAAYVARYCVKKVNGPRSEDHYRYVDDETGEIHDRIPEYATMSRRPGIGKNWFEKYSSDVYPSDFLVVNGHKAKPPRYYDQLFKEENSSLWDDILDDRRSLAEGKDSLTVERLQVKEKCKKAQLNLKKRIL